MAHLDSSSDAAVLRGRIAALEHENRELKPKAEAFDKLRTVITAKHWRPAERVTLATMVIATVEVEGDHNGWRRLEAKSAEQLAELVGRGVSKQTVNDIVGRLKDENVGLLKRILKRDAFNRDSEPIPISAVNKDRGDYVISDVTFEVKAEIPAELPPLPESEYQDKARSKAAAQRAEFVEVKAKLQALIGDAQCPHCHEVGHLHVEHAEIVVACKSCGVILGEAEIDTLFRGEECPVAADLEPSEVQTPPQSPETAIRHHKLPASEVQTVSVNERGISETHEPSEKSSVTVQMSGISDGAGSTEVEGCITDYAAPDATGEILTGAATVEYLDGLGAKFSFAEPRSKIGINPRDDAGHEVNHLDAPADAEAAKLHLAHGGNVGVLCEHSEGLAVIDVDQEAPEFIRAHPALALAPRIIRRNAPDRCKVVVLCPDIGDSVTIPPKRKDEPPGTRHVELIGKRKPAIVAGIHESGAPIELIAGYEIVLMTWGQLVEIAEEWTGATTPSLSASKPMLARAAADHLRAVHSSGDMVCDAIHWWIAQPVNQVEVDRLLDGCKQRGAYVSVRADDGTPSTRRTDTRDGFHKRTWRDYGSGETLDDYELYCRLQGIDKRVHKWQVVNDWRESRGLPALRLDGAR